MCAGLCIGIWVSVGAFSACTTAHPIKSRCQSLLVWWRVLVLTFFVSWMDPLKVQETLCKMQLVGLIVHFYPMKIHKKTRSFCCFLQKQNSKEKLVFRKNFSNKKIFFPFFEESFLQRFPTADLPLAKYTIFLLFIFCLPICEHFRQYRRRSVQVTLKMFFVLM